MTRSRAGTAGFCANCADGEGKFPVRYATAPGARRATAQAGSGRYEQEPELKLKDSKACLKAHVPGHVAEDAKQVRTSCRFGYCVILRCPACGLKRGGWGPVTCPCKKNENSTLRWYKYPAMDKQEHHAPVKENAMGRKRSRKKKSGKKNGPVAQW